jgi:catechol 2,3-dioxygenase-like lactoylglutathione lyase family enzyme
LPGSNWHVYPLDTEGHPNELYYGMEQIGWDGYSKPMDMHRVRYTCAPDLPHRSEYAEIQDGYQDGVDPRSGYRHQEPQSEVHEVGGVLLGRPFKIVKIGPIRLFVKDMEQACAFYRDAMGLVVTQEVEWKGHRCVFLRANTEHHSIALYPIELREELGLNTASTLFSFGFQVGDYQQLRSALEFLQAQGVDIRYLPSELTPGIDYSAYAVDPDGNAVELYYYMEQIGWDGSPRPPSGTSTRLPWPEVIDAKSDTFMGETFLGPLA